MSSVVSEARPRGRPRTKPQILPGKSYTNKSSTKTRKVVCITPPGARAEEKGSLVTYSSSSDKSKTVTGRAFYAWAHKEAET